MAIVYYYVRDFFSFIGDVVTFVFNLIMSLIGVLAAAAQWLFDVVTSLPLILIVPVTALIVISILYKVLGRENQS